MTPPTFKPFYVTGLPRSRTSWLSVALSDWNQTACIHEPLIRWPDTSVETAVAELAKTRTPFAGISDCGLPVASPDLVDLLPGPALVVWRDPAEVLQSLMRFMPAINGDELAGMLALLHYNLAQFVDRYKPMVVGFDRLADEQVIRQIWQHLLPGVKFQKRRIASLQRLRIDPDPAQLLDGASVQQLTRMRGLLQAAS